MKHKILSATFAVALAATGLSYATLTGLDSSPLGDRSSLAIEFGTWDAFATKTFTGLAAGSGDLGLTLAQSDATPFGPFMGDYFYTSTGSTDWTLSGTATIDINTLVVQIKLSPPASGTTTGFFTTTLNAVGAAPVQTASGIEVGGAGGLASTGFSVVKWTWTGLDIESGQSFNIHFTSPAGAYHVALDTITVDVAAVPEPSTYGIAAALLLAVVIWRRRNALRKGAA